VTDKVTVTTKSRCVDTVSSELKATDRWWPDSVTPPKAGRPADIRQPSVQPQLRRSVQRGEPQECPKELT